MVDAPAERRPRPRPPRRTTPWAPATAAPISSHHSSKRGARPWRGPADRARRRRAAIGPAGDAERSRPPRGRVPVPDHAVEVDDHPVDSRRARAAASLRGRPPAHRCGVRADLRAMRASRPLTKRPESSVENREASSTASAITTPVGTSGRATSSYGAHAQRGPVERPACARASTPRRSAEQLVDPGAVLVDRRHQRDGERVGGDGQARRAPRRRRSPLASAS